MTDNYQTYASLMSQVAGENEDAYSKAMKAGENLRDGKLKEVLEPIGSEVLRETLKPAVVSVGKVIGQKLGLKGATEFAKDVNEEGFGKAIGKRVVSAFSRKAKQALQGEDEETPAEEAPAEEGDIPMEDMSSVPAEEAPAPAVEEAPSSLVEQPVADIAEEVPEELEGTQLGESLTALTATTRRAQAMVAAKNFLARRNQPAETESGEQAPKPAEEGEGGEGGEGTTSGETAGETAEETAEKEVGETAEKEVGETAEKEVGETAGKIVGKTVGEEGGELGGEIAGISALDALGPLALVGGVLAILGGAGIFNKKKHEPKAPRPLNSAIQFGA